MSRVEVQLTDRLGSGKFGEVWKGLHDARFRRRFSLQLSSSLTDSIISCGSGGSVAEWLACWTQAQKGLGSNRSRDAVG